MPIPIYKAPVLDLDVKSTIEIPLTRTIGAGAQDTRVSGMITYPFRIIQTKMFFGRNARNLIQYYWLYSSENSESTTGIPSGKNIYTKLTPLVYFIGEAEIKTINSQIDVLDKDQYIKLHIVNGLGVAYDGSGTITIQEL